MDTYENTVPTTEESAQPAAEAVDPAAPAPEVEAPAQAQPEVEPAAVTEEAQPEQPAQEAAPAAEAPQPAQTEVPQSIPVQQTAPTRKPSPYADSPYARSPYVDTPRAASPYANSPYAAPAGNSPYANSPYAKSPYVHQTQPVSQPKSRQGKAWKAVLCVFLALVFLVCGCVLTALAVNTAWELKLAGLQQQYDDKLAELEDKIGSAGGNTVVISGEASQGGGYTPAQVYAMCVDGVVIINAKITRTEYGQTTNGISTGSGFVISQDGYVVTNYHVVEGGTSITVGTNDGTRYSAQLIGYDDTNDVALLKVDATGLHYLPLGDSDQLIVGDQVAAVGNPLGELTSTLTVGYISAKERDVNTDGFAINMLQTDAAINSGNSGGPLLNMRGEVIGITTAKYSGTSSSGATIEGVGFAIPINDVTDLLEELMTYGFVNSGYLGVSVSDASNYGTIPGAYVEEVVAGYAAYRAGVRAGDIIMAVGDYEVRNVSELTRTMRKFAPGDTTTITVCRGGRDLTMSITLDEKPKDTSSQTTPTLPTETPTEDEWAYWYDYLKPFFNENSGQDYDEWFQQFKDQFGK